MLYNFKTEDLRKASNLQDHEAIARELDIVHCLSTTQKLFMHLKLKYNLTMLQKSIQRTKLRDPTNYVQTTTAPLHKKFSGGLISCFNAFLKYALFV